MEEEHSKIFGRWAVQTTLLTTLALAVFWSFYSIDYWFPNWLWSVGEGTPLARYLDFDPRLLPDAFSSLAGVIAAVFGIVVTVVSIIVQLAANRFAGVTRMFLRDTINASVIAYYIVVCVCGVWLSPALQTEHVPKTAFLSVLVMTTLGIVLMAPYFGYVFWFLEPLNIVARIRRDAQRRVLRGAGVKGAEARARAQARVLTAMEELTDIVRHSISHKDKITSSGAVDALRDFALFYADHKAQASAAWFSIGSGIRDNPDFVAMDGESLLELEERRTWIEWKVMRQYLGLYNEALGQMPDINYLIAIDTRYIGEGALLNQDRELSRLVFRYMNSYLRSTLNARDVRTAYNVMNQYRLLIETMLRGGEPVLAAEGAEFMKYYGHISFDQNLPFVTETVAYDLAVLCERAHQEQADSESTILEHFLELDRPLRSPGQEEALLGVRKAQIKLACYYLVHGEEQRARTIADDMSEEPRERLEALRSQLERVSSKDFWEIIDRGRNFEFMVENQRAQLPRFFSLIDESEGQASQASTSEKPSASKLSSEKR